MAESLLTSSQIEDLLGIFRRGRDPSHDADVVRSFDLSHPTRIPQGVQQELRGQYEQSARVLSKDLAALLDLDLGVTLDGFEQMQFGAWRESLGSGACAQLLRWTGIRDPAVLAIDRSFAFLALERLLGCSGEPTGLGPTRELSSTEVAILADVTDLAVAAQLRAWQVFVVMEEASRHNVPNVATVRDIAPEDPVLATSFAISGALPSRIQFALPIAELEPHLQRAPRQELRKTEAAECRARLLNNLRPVGLRVSVSLGQAEIRLRDLLELVLKVQNRW